MNSGILLGAINVFRGFIKDIISCFKWKEEDKLVDINWFKNSGLEEKLNNEGFVARWSNANKINNRLLEGYKIHYEEDKKKRIRYRLIDSSNNILIKKLNK